KKSPVPLISLERRGEASILRFLADDLMILSDNPGTYRFQLLVVLCLAEGGAVAADYGGDVQARQKIGARASCPPVFDTRRLEARGPTPARQSLRRKHAGWKARGPTGGGRRGSFTDHPGTQSYAAGVTANSIPAGLHVYRTIIPKMSSYVRPLRG